MPAEEFLTLEGRPTVRVERRFPHPIDKVWSAVTTPEHLGAWFPSPVQFELRPGAPMRFGAFDGQPAATGTVERVEAPRLVSFLWGADRLVFELDPEGDATTFRLTHTFDDRYGAASFAAGWELCLAALRCAVAGQDAPAPGRAAARHEELVHQFGLDQPEVIEADGRWTVRVERQLTCPARYAWDLWFGKDRDTGAQRSAPAPGQPLTPYQAPDRVFGTMTEVDPYRAFAFDIATDGGPGEHLRLELGPGTGHGARAVLTVTGTDPAERDAASQMWGMGAIGHLAALAAEWAPEQPVAG